MATARQCCSSRRHSPPLVHVKPSPAFWQCSLTLLLSSVRKNVCQGTSTPGEKLRMYFRPFCSNRSRSFGSSAWYTSRQSTTGEQPPSFATITEKKLILRGQLVKCELSW